MQDYITLHNPNSVIGNNIYPNEIKKNWQKRSFIVGPEIIDDSSQSTVNDFEPVIFQEVYLGT